MNIVTEKKIGNFKITKELIECASEELFSLFSKIIIVRCEYVYPDLFEYRGYSEMFEPIKKGCLIPEYIFNITKKGTGKITLSAEKRI